MIVTGTMALASVLLAAPKPVKLTARAGEYTVELTVSAPHSASGPGGMGLFIPDSAFTGPPTGGGAGKPGDVVPGSGTGKLGKRVAGAQQGPSLGLLDTRKPTHGLAVRFKNKHGRYDASMKPPRLVAVRKDLRDVALTMLPPNGEFFRSNLRLPGKGAYHLLLTATDIQGRPLLGKFSFSY